MDYQKERLCKNIFREPFRVLDLHFEELEITWIDFWFLTYKPKATSHKFLPYSYHCSLKLSVYKHFLYLPKHSKNA